MTATAEQERQFAARLREIIVWALNEIPNEAAKVAVADLLDAGHWRLMTRFDLDDDGRPDPLSLRYVVEVFWLGGWEPLCDAKRSALGVTPELALDEAKWTLRQHGQNIPNDLSSLEGSPP